MSAVPATIQALLASAPVVAITTAARVYPATAPQGSAMPAIIVYQVSDGTDQHLTGDSGWNHARVTVECRGATFTATDGLAKAVIAALRVREGTFGGIFASIRKGGSDVTDFNDNHTTPVHRRMVDFDVHYR